MSKKDDLISQRRRMQTDAVNLALRGDWEKAIELNEEMYRRDNTDIETLNRLAKAYFESGDVDAAKRTYERVLELSELNPIAKRALLAIDRSGALLKRQREYVDMRNFVIETGKSVLTTIHVDQADPVALLPGEVVFLVIHGKATEAAPKAAKKSTKAKKDAESEVAPAASVQAFEISTKYAIPSVLYTSGSILEDANAVDVHNVDGQLIGRLEPRLAQRIIRFMRAGHCYAAVVWRVSEHFHNVDLVIREIYHNPDFRGEVSFPGKLIDEDKAPLLDLADDEIDEGSLDSGYDEHEEMPRLSYDDDDDTFEGGEESNEDGDEIDEYAASKKPKSRAGAPAKQTYGEKEVSLSELAQDEAKGEDVEEE